MSGAADILIVEDNRADLEMTLRALKKARLLNPIQVAEDGAEALEYLQGAGHHAGRETSRLPRVMLLDLKLPKLSGLDVLRRVRDDERLRALPVVVLTSSRQQPDIEEAYRLGVNSYIVKPVEFESFIGAVGNVGLYWMLLNEPPR